MAKYETMLVVSTALDEEATQALIAKFKTLIEENGTIENVEEWGKRKLAYPINDETEGYYVVTTFEAAPEFPAELTRIYRLTDGVLRAMTVAKED